MNTIRKQAQGACEAIDRMCEPKKMTKIEAIEFLEEIISHCEMSVEALKDELQEDD